MKRWLIFLVLFILGGTFLQLAEAKSFRLALPGYRYHFPADHAAHEDFKTEWWYYTGHLRSKSGKTFGYELTFFRMGTGIDNLPKNSDWALVQLYPAHFAISDATTQAFHFWEKLSRGGGGLAGADTAKYLVWNQNWRVRQQGDKHFLSAASNGNAINLTLTPLKPPVIHGKNGVSQKASCKGCASHYYSYTRMQTTGSITVNGETMDVSGLSWMDHEFGSNQLTSDQTGWDWFSIQLDNDTELMLYLMRTKSGIQDQNSSGTFVAASNQSRHLGEKDFSVHPMGHWTSPATKAVYPSGWQVSVPSQKLSLTITPLFKNQELVTRASTNTAYWEGACTVTGTFKGRPIQGEAYVELTGYDKPFRESL